MWKKNHIDAKKNVDTLLAAVKDVKDDDSLQALIDLMRSNPRS
jgi:hypothetical protein